MLFKSIFKVKVVPLELCSFSKLAFKNATREAMFFKPIPSFFCEFLIPLPLSSTVINKLFVQELQWPLRVLLYY